MLIKCTYKDFGFYHEIFYSCCFDSVQIQENGDNFFSGDHADGKTDNDVQAVRYISCDISEIPAGLTKTFPNLKFIQIYNCNLEKICKNDLVEYKNLEKFTCSRCKLEYLPGDLFEGFNNLEFIELYENNLTVIEPNIFEEIKTLKYIDMENNPNFNERFITYEGYSNSTFEEIVGYFYDKFLNLDLQIIKDFLKKVENPIDMLKKFKEKANSNESSLKVLELVFDFIDNFQQEAGLIKDLKNFIHNENSKDFQIQIEEKEFKVHKFVLAARSPVLAETLKNNPEVENLNLIDIPVETFEQVLNFLYTDELPGEGTNYLHLFVAAGKLKITDLQNHAASKLLDLINDENVYEIFKLSHKYNQIDLRQRAFDEIKVKYSKIKFNDGWVADPERVLLIIEKFKKKERAIKKLEDEFNDDLKSMI